MTQKLERQDASKKRSLMIKKIIIIVGVLLIPFWMLLLFPYIWKFAGGSFVWDNKIIYHGKELFVIPDGCSASFTKDLDRITLYCGESKRTWVHGEEIKRVEDIK